MARESVIRIQPFDETEGRTGLVYPGLTVPLILIVTCFAAWGSATNLTDVLMGAVRNIFSMSNFHSALARGDLAQGRRALSAGDARAASSDVGIASRTTACWSTCPCCPAGDGEPGSCTSCTSLR
jgi:hypothetical protein